MALTLTERRAVAVERLWRFRATAPLPGCLIAVPYRDKLPVLELQVASPCTQRWEAMHGDGRVRYCGACKQHVYDLESLSRDEAEALFAEHGGKACVRYYQRVDGTVLLRDCVDGMRIRMPPQQIMLWVMLILVGSVSLVLVAMECARGKQSFGAGQLVSPSTDLWG